MPSKIVVELGGGIGNQLFQYYGGQLLAQKLNKKLVLDDSSLKWESANLSRKDLGLTQSSLRELVPEFFPKKKVENRIHYLGIKLFRKLLKELRLRNELNLYTEKIDSTVQLIALSERITHKSITLKGNLQSNTIVETALSLGAREIKSTKEASNLDRVKPIVVHVRLTDYVVENPLKMIPANYYKDGLTLAVKEFPDSPIWLFSDDPDSALDYLPGQFKAKLSFVNDPKKNSDWTELQLMSNGCAYIIPNSTFGYWAAKLSDATMIISPKPWFKGSISGGTDTYFDYPFEWTQLDW
jgi:hypothetical protein